MSEVVQAFATSFVVRSHFHYDDVLDEVVGEMDGMDGLNAGLTIDEWKTWYRAIEAHVEHNSCV